MTAFTHGFLVLDGQGRHVGVVDNVEDAQYLAEEEAGSGSALWLASGEDEAPRENRTREQIEEEPMIAWRQSRVGRIDLERAIRLSPSKDVLPALNNIQRQMGLPPFGDPPVRSFVSVNTKTGKLGYATPRGEVEIKAGVRGISLAPAEIAFKHKKAMTDLVARDAGRRPTFCFRSVESCRRACLVGVGKNAIPDKRGTSSKAHPGGISRHPKSFLGMPVISGDKHDVRPLDRFHQDAQDGPVVVGLRFKAPWYLDLVDRGKQPRENFKAFVIDVYETSGGILVGSQVPSYLKGSDSIRVDDLLSASLDERRAAFERAADALRGETDEKKRKSAVKAGNAASERSPSLVQQRTLEQQRIIERDERARKRALERQRLREQREQERAARKQR